MQRIFFHVDVNSAFLSWSAIGRLREDPTSVDLRTIPSAVGGDVESRHGIITAKSIPAKKYHIETGEPVVRALEKCPDLVLVPSNFKLYVQFSRALMDILKEYAPEVIQYSIDEAFCDMTGTSGLYGDLVLFAHKLKNEIRDRLGFTVNIGISSNMLLAKMASDFEKPDKVHTLFPEEIEEKMWPLPVGDLFSVGKSTREALVGMGIYTIGDLAHTDQEILISKFKSFGSVLYRYANGMPSEDDFTSRGKDRANKSYSNEITISHDIRNREEARLVLLSLAESVGRRLRADQFKAHVVQVYFKDADFKVHSRQTSLSYGTNSTEELYEVGLSLFDELWQMEPIRLMGIAGAKAEEENVPEQMDLFGNEERERREKLDKAVDELRDRFGRGAITRASLMDSKVKIRDKDEMK